MRVSQDIIHEPTASRIYSGSSTTTGIRTDPILTFFFEKKNVFSSFMKEKEKGALCTWYLVRIMNVFATCRCNVLPTTPFARWPLWGHVVCTLLGLPNEQVIVVTQSSWLLKSRRADLFQFQVTMGRRIRRARYMHGPEPCFPIQTRLPSNTYSVRTLPNC